MPAHRKPTELTSALSFGLLYALALLAVAAGKEYLGSGGLYVVALLSGLTAMDAITLPTARFVDTGRLPAGNAWRLILVALLANVLLKADSGGISTRVSQPC